MSDEIDRTVLPLRRPAFTGALGETLGDSTLTGADRAREATGGSPEHPAGAHR